MVSHVSIQDIEFVTIHLLLMEEMNVMEQENKKKFALNVGECGHHSSTKDGVNGLIGQAVVKDQVKGLGQPKLNTKHVLQQKKEYVDAEMLETLTGNMNRGIGYKLKDILHSMVKFILPEDI